VLRTGLGYPTRPYAQMAAFAPVLAGIAPAPHSEEPPGMSARLLTAKELPERR